MEFRVFAYNRKKVSVIIKTGGGTKELRMSAESEHLYSTTAEGLELPVLYKFKLDEEAYPDPYSNYQPCGVHGFSQLIDHDIYAWRDTEWRGRELQELVTMEIHTGTFTREGTFKAISRKLDYLLELGINAVELMPVTQTPGRWNWGYDGANFFSVNHNYGTPDDLKQLVDCCHEKGIAIILDVVYNHLGPEGNYLHAYGPYFTDKYTTPWGAAVNFDDSFCEFTRKMVLDNARYWLETFHFDGLRLDAVHAIKDNSNPHILKEISNTARSISIESNRKKFVIAESDENDTRLINSHEDGGYGIDAQWMDDFHHCIHTSLTGEQGGYYMDYGRFEDFDKVFKNYVYTGQYSPYWKKNRGTDGSRNPGYQFVVAAQNHDQVGNRAGGERLSLLVEFPYLKTASGLVFFSAYLPLIFMGEEYGEKNPFLFFTDYGSAELQEAVSKGRRKEFEDFNWTHIPDPQDPGTFYSSKLTPEKDWNENNRLLFDYYRQLIRLRTSHPVLQDLNKYNLNVSINSTNKFVKIKRWNSTQLLTGFFNLGKSETTLDSAPGKLIFDSTRPPYRINETAPSYILNYGQVLIFETNL